MSGDPCLLQAWKGAAPRTGARFVVCVHKCVYVFLCVVLSGVQVLEDG